MNHLVSLYDSTVEITARQISQGEYLTPVRHVLDLTQEISDLRTRYNLITKQQEQKWRYQLYFALCGS